MRKYDIKNKRNIGIIIVISVIIIVMFSLVISLFLKADKKEYQVLSGTLVFDKDKTIIKVDNNESVIKTKWNNDYYLIYNKKNYELGDTAISYNENNGQITLYGRYYEISSGDEIKVTSDETVIKDSALTKFYKLADRKYLVVDREIKSSDGLLSTTDFLMVELDKVGNATLTNHKVSLKTFSETEIVTSNYTFDIANEILTYGSDIIDLKKIIGSTNTYTKEDLAPEKGSGTGVDGVTDVTDNSAGTGTGGSGGGGGGAGGSGDGTGTGEGNGDGSGTGSGSGGGSGGNIILEEIKKASRNTSIVSINSSVSTISVDYVIYDPYSEYTSVYMEFKETGSNNVKTIYLNSRETDYVISDGILPNTSYDIVFKSSYIDQDTGEEIIETIDEKNIKTKLPSLGIKVTSTSFGKITYKITTDNSYALTSGTLVVYIKDKSSGVFNEHSRYNININGNTVDSIVITDILDEDIVQFKLIDVMTGGTIIQELQASCMFKY